ncbi:MAG: metal-dependent transcriptional regulator [Candidatus Hodarchaeales archaeon]
MIKSKSSSREEILEHLWIHEVEEKEAPITENDLNKKVIDHDLDVKRVIADLEEEGSISIKNGLISLTDRGLSSGFQVVRCHRLAERLLADVLDLSHEQLDSAACGFEHAITEDVAESICTLLGHPSSCPHGKYIPPGRCCNKKSMIAKAAIVSLADVEPGHEGIVSYISTRKHNRLQKLMGFGVLPGALVTVIRNSPGIVLQVDETIIALENAVVRDIYLRKVKKTNKSISFVSRPPFRRRMRHRLGWKKD